MKIMMNIFDVKMNQKIAGKRPKNEEQNCREKCKKAEKLKMHGK